MIVSEIFNDAKEVLGFCDDAKVFSRLTDAIEALANKGQWEPLLAYLVIPVTNQNYVILPDTIEVPLRVNLSGNPAFGRDKLYEFTMNGPGTLDERVDWSWEDQGDIDVIGADQNGNITSEASANGRRVIRISTPGSWVRMLVRRKTAAITSKTDFVPLHSKLAILLMLKAIESFRKGTPDGFQLGQGQEAQALKFLQEEQSSRNAFSDLANATDKAPTIGYAFHSNNMVVVQDIYDEASSILGGVGKQHVFDAISEAVEVLANKGQWDGMTAYLDMIPNSDLIGLPRQVEIPIRINIEDKPSISRSRLFEFSTNGPGTDLDEVNILTWEDQGDGPLLVPLTRPQPISVGGNEADQGKRITVYGYDAEGAEQQHVYRIPANEDQQAGSPIIWKQITRITKEVTNSLVYVFANYAVAAVLYPDEVEGKYRQIKLNRPASAIKIMFRKASLKIASTSDLIPLKSRSAITTMLRALQLMKDPAQIDAGMKLEAQAIKFLQEEEQSRLAFIQAASKDQMPALGISTNAQGVVTAGEVYDDACDIFGPIGRQQVFDKITEAMEALANKSQWDGLDGYVDIVADQRGYITFPRRVETPVAVNFYRCPAEIKNKWYEFHLNGLGSDPVRSNSLHDLGEYPLVVEPTSPVRLFARTFFQQDAEVKLRVYGYDNTGNWIRSLEDDQFVDGEAIPLSVVQNQSEQPLTVPTTYHEFRQITRITKGESDMPIDIFATQSQYQPTEYTNPALVDTPVSPQILATYEADETEPMFRRMRVPEWVQWARIRYRLRTMKITKMTDVLNMKSKTALVEMMRALKSLETDLKAYVAHEAVAVKLISEEQMSRSPAETFDLQFDQSVCFADPLQGQY